MHAFIYFFIYFGVSIVSGQIHSKYTVITNRDSPKLRAVNGEKYLLSFSNSTSSVERLCFYTNLRIGCIMGRSIVIVGYCRIGSSSIDSLFENDLGEIVLNDIRVDLSGLSSLVSCSSGLRVEVQRCEFGDMVRRGGDFVMSGRVEREQVRGCLFENISMKGDEKGCMSEECIVEETIMKDVERGIYGWIVSAGNEFRMRNSTLIRNFREGNDGTCSTSLTSNCSTSSRIELSTSTSYSFTDCTFTNCSSTDGKGGALVLNASNQFSLTLEGCTFTNCSTIVESPYGLSSCYGGAIFVFSSYSCSISLSDISLLDCLAHSSTHVLSYAHGGGIYISCNSSQMAFSSIALTTCRNISAIFSVFASISFLPV